MTSSDMQKTSYELTRSLPVWLWISGLASIALGVAAMTFPFAATLAAELLFGAILGALGVMQILRALLSERAGPRLWTLVFGAISLLAGVVLLLYPLHGTLTLTIVLASFFTVGGIFKMLSAWYIRPDQLSKLGHSPIEGWWWIGLSGALSLVVGVLLFAGLPATATWALGLLIGIDFLILGMTEIAFALVIGRADKRG